MAAPQRRQALLDELKAAQGPLSGGKLAKKLGVTRQVIVGDVALLRADGHDIISTARGYVLGSLGPAQAAAPAAGAAAAQVSRVIKVRHSVEQTSDELFTVLENGGQVLDVMVNHRVYGKISAPLGITTRADALKFLADIASGKSSPLLTVTSGYHYHTIAASSEEALNRIERALDSKGYLAPLSPKE